MPKAKNIFLCLHPLRHKSGTDCFPQILVGESEGSSSEQHSQQRINCHLIILSSPTEFKIFTKNGDFICNTCERLLTVAIASVY